MKGHLSKGSSSSLGRISPMSSHRFECDVLYGILYTFMCFRGSKDSIGSSEDNISDRSIDKGGFQIVSYLCKFETLMELGANRSSIELLGKKGHLAMWFLISKFKLTLAARVRL